MANPTNNPVESPTTQFPFIMAPASPSGSSDTINQFYQTLLDNVQDGIVFVDANARTLAWNQSLEMMTGLSAKKMDRLELTSSLFGLADGFGNPIPPSRDPLAECLRLGKKKSGDFKLIGRSGREIKVEMTFAPVIDSRKTLHGAVVMVHDASVQLDLQRQLKDLYEFSMLDPLTQVANRAEFERALDEFVRARRDSNFQCCLIIADIDFFKQINDNYNHHVGDQALVAFAALLKKFVRAKDVVARYGGEEFVILCADCDRDSAMQRAEEIRMTLMQTAQPMLDGKYITASFGVAELRQMESATDLFIRADTALLKAKEQGRNRVVVADMPLAGPGRNSAESPEQGKPTVDMITGVAWPQMSGKQLLTHQYRTRTPLAVIVEKMRGYIVEKDAELRRVESDFASLEVEFEDPLNFGRKGRFEIEIDFHERDEDHKEGRFGRRTYTYLRITVREGKRKWFSQNITELAPAMLSELQRYFMISDPESQMTSIHPATVPKER